MTHISPLTGSRLAPILAQSVRDDGGTLSLLRGHPLFEVLDDADFDRMLSLSRCMNLDARELLYSQDSKASHFYFVRTGQVRLYRLDHTGTERTLDSRGQGSCLAEVMVYADPACYACYAESMTPTQVIAFPLSAYRSMVRQDLRYAERLLRFLAGNVVSRFKDLEVMTVQNAKERLIRYLLDLEPVTPAQADTCMLPLPQYLIASRLAMQPETLSRFLNELKKARLITLRGKHLKILDPEGLRMLCHSSDLHSRKAG